MAELRQQVLVLYLQTSALDSGVIGWARYDGTGQHRHTSGDSLEPPYETGLDALLDGWRLFQASQLIRDSAAEGTSFLKHEFYFEKMVPING